MKKTKTFITMLAAIAAMILLPGIFTLKASAAERATYNIRYNPGGKEWYVLTDIENDDEQPKAMDFYYHNVKCGDAVVVYCGYDDAPQLDLGTVRLGNVTILPGSSFVMIKSAGIADFFALGSSASSISAPVINAYVYDPAVVNFNSNVKDILLTVDGWDSSTSMGGLGTVDSLKVHFESDNTSYTLYDFKKGTFSFVNGATATASYNFSYAPSATSANRFQLSVGNQPTVSTLKDVFDERYYADTYADLKAVFGYNREALWTHYITCGIKEGRSMNSLLNVTSYRYQYPDLNAAFGDNWDAYLTHYLTLGAKEGRDSGTDFKAMEYANWYEDLGKAYGNNVLALWQHYKTIGVEWSRQP